jgi:UDP:flavonoid glycosyltransferase YjiC (YdhE family)
LINQKETASTASVNVFICPLDWGLGHATRIVPVIRRYIDSGHRVILGGSGKSGELLKSHFGYLPFISVPSYSIRYPSHGFLLLLSVFLQLPFFTYSIFREYFFLKRIISENNINVVISDNRYGLFSAKTHNVFITHQISPVLPAYLKPAEYPLFLLIRYMISKFDECWIPDYPGKDNLTGKLSHRYKLPANARFIGPLSRFSQGLKSSENNNSYDVVIVLSGQQPQLGKFTRHILDQASGLKVKTLIISGRQKEIPLKKHPWLTMAEDLSIEEFQDILLRAGLIICRSGYSSIMDLVALDKTALLVPTLGQPEQEYLANWLQETGRFRFVKQQELDLIKLSEDYLRIKTTNITANPSRNPV